MTKRSESLKLYYQTHPHPWTGRKHTLEECAKISKGGLGKKKPATSEKFKGAGNPNWKGDNVGKWEGGWRARHLFTCPEGKERHHKDGNPMNNNPSNIEFLSRREHMIKDGRLFAKKAGKFCGTIKVVRP